MPPRLLIFIPAKNEAPTIGTIIPALRERFAHLEEPPSILVIDDGSQDGTAAAAERAGAAVIRHARSQGLGRAFQEAHQHALNEGVDFLLTIDGDRQFQESDLVAIYELLRRDGLDFVSGSRFLPESRVEAMPASKRWGNRLLARVVASITRRPVTDSTCGLRGYSATALAALHTFSRFTYTHEVILNLGLKPLRFGEVPVTVRYFPERVSRIAGNLFRYGAKTASILVQSLLLYQPARLFGTLALPFFLAGVPAAGFVGIRYVFTGFVSPYKSIGIFGLVATTIAVVLATSGALLQITARTQATLEQLLFEQRKKR